MTGNQMAFNYAQHQLIYSHDINSYYHWFVLKRLGKTVVSFINALLDLRKIKIQCQSTMMTWIFCTHQSACIHFYNILFWYRSSVYRSWPCLFIVEHQNTYLMNILYILVISLFDVQVLFNSYAQDPNPLPSFPCHSRVSV